MNEKEIWCPRCKRAILLSEAKTHSYMPEIGDIREIPSRPVYMIEDPETHDTLYSILADDGTVYRTSFAYIRLDTR